MIGIDARSTALGQGRAFGRLIGRRIVRVGGGDAVGWLQDLLTADIAALTPGTARRTFLLTPTGRIRADLWALRRDDEIVLVHDVGAGAPIDELLAPYVLTADVTVSPDEGVVLVCLPSSVDLPEAFTPSMAGGGVDALLPADGAVDELFAELAGHGWIEAGTEAQEHLRVLRGIPRMGADFDGSNLPAEAGLEDVIAVDKGCFLGQESVARIRNLGHPPTVLRHVRADRTLSPGDAVLAAGVRAGTVTSACRDGAGAVALVRLAWAHRDADLLAPDGRPLHPVAAPA